MIEVEHQDLCPAGYAAHGQTTRCLLRRGHPSDGGDVFAFHHGGTIIIAGHEVLVTWSDSDPRHVPTATSPQQEFGDVQ